MYYKGLDLQTITEMILSVIEYDRSALPALTSAL